MSRPHPALPFIQTTIGFFGYTNLVLAWFWIGILVLPGIARSGVLDWSQPDATSAPTPVISVEPSPFTTAIALATTILVLTITVVVLLRLPRTITRTGNRAIHTVSEAAVPIVTHHRPIAQKKKRELTRRVTLVLQLALFLPPLIGSFFVPTAGEVNREIIVMISLILSLSGALWFLLNYAITSITSRTRSHASRGSR